MAWVFLSTACEGAIAARDGGSDAGGALDAASTTRDGAPGTIDSASGVLDASGDAAPPVDATPGGEPDATMSTPYSVPGGKSNYSVVYGNLDTTGTTWVRHASYTFRSTGTVAATLWQWDSDARKGKTAYTEHRCTMAGATKTCTTYTPTGWVYPARQYFSASGTFSLAETGAEVTIAWSDGRTESWSIGETSTEGLRSLSFLSSTFGITHGAGFGSNASWSTFRTLPEIVAAGGLKPWPGRAAGAASNGSTITASDWRPSTVNLSSFTSASWSSAGYTLHAMLPHSPSVCTGACTGSHTGYIMYHLASTNTNRQMAYNNWCTCLSIGSEWPCYDRNMHPLALHSVLDDSGTHRGWLFIEQQNQPGYDGYQYQLGYWDDL